MARQGDLVAISLDANKGRLAAKLTERNGSRWYLHAAEDVNLALSAWRKREGRKPWHGVPCWEELLALMIRGHKREADDLVVGWRSLHDVVQPMIHEDTAMTGVLPATHIRPVCIDADPASGLSVMDATGMQVAMPLDQWDRFLEDRRFTLPIQPLSVGGKTGHYWWEVDDGRAHSWPQVPFAFFANVRRRYYADPPIRIEDGEIRTPLRFTNAHHDRFYVLDPIGYLATHLAPFAFETVLRTLIALGVMTVKGVLDDPQILHVKLDERRASVPMPCFSFQFAYGATAVDAQHCSGRLVLAETNSTQVMRFHTLESLWERFGIPGMDLPTYLKLREKGTLINRG